ncbi:EF-hand domain-containing protein [uncultured Jannaschia sp.]|uniref:EF-hand domain-containing protein n=1 Tax=uncultured Jannaschia sp. TaxID=293347 RepID=UPI0026392721|nr:EF-hand domain-containing protein [uncultured Jannaschia sp.]
MTRILTTTAAVLALTAPAFAQVAMDTDADGNVTYEEYIAAYPDSDADTFASMDSDGDSVLSAAEVEAAVEAGLLPS